MSPHVFRGLWCQCGEVHRQGGRYYVSVEDGGRHVLALGPFPEHDQALARVDDVRRLVLEQWNPGGKAHWYGYGTACAPSTYNEPGKLNAAMGV